MSTLAQRVQWLRASGKQHTLCWWCNKPLVGPGGVAGKQPLYCKFVTNPNNSEVPLRVHVACEESTKNFFEHGVKYDEF